MNILVLERKLFKALLEGGHLSSHELLLRLIHMITKCLEMLLYAE